MKHRTNHQNQEKKVVVTFNTIINFNFIPKMPLSLNVVSDGYI